MLARLVEPRHVLVIIGVFVLLCGCSCDGSLRTGQASDGTEGKIGPEKQEKPIDVVGERECASVPGSANGQLVNSVGMRFRKIMPAEFVMEYEGTPEFVNTEPYRARRPLERRSGQASPRTKKVTINQPFYIGQFEISEAEFERVLGRKPANRVVHMLWVPEEDPNRPACSVTWEEVQEFCKKLSELPEEKRAGRVYRLPSEAELVRAQQTADTHAFCRFERDYPLLTSHRSLWEFVADPESSDRKAPPGARLLRKTARYADAFHNSIIFRVVVEVPGS